MAFHEAFQEAGQPQKGSELFSSGAHFVPAPWMASAALLAERPGLGLLAEAAGSQGLRSQEDTCLDRNSM